MTDYYVKTDGNDGDSGLDWDNAWASVDKAATTPVAGDTITYADGTYDVGGGQTTWNSGSEGNIITHQALNARQVVWARSANGQVMDLQTSDDYITFDGIIFDGDQTSGGWTGSFCVEISGSDYIVFDNCEIRDTETWGFYVRAGSTHLDFLDCDVHSDFYVDGASYDGYLFHGLGITDIQIIGGSCYHWDHVGIYFNAGLRVLVEDVHIYDVHSHCLQFGSPGAGNGFTIDECEARLCEIHGSENWGDPDAQYHQLIYITGGDVTAVNVIKCTLYSADGSCIQLGNRIAGPIYVDGNTMYDPNAQGHADKACLDCWSDTTYPVVHFRNNILVSTVAAGWTMRIAGRYDDNWDGDHNCFHEEAPGNTKIYRNSTTYNTYADYLAVFETNSLDDNPDMTDPGNADFTLTAPSPCIDAGTGIGEPYTGDAPDIGAHEYQAGAGSVVVVVPVTVTVTVTVPVVVQA